MFHGRLRQCQGAPLPQATVCTEPNPNSNQTIHKSAKGGSQDASAAAARRPRGGARFWNVDHSLTQTSLPAVAVLRSALLQQCLRRA